MPYPHLNPPQVPTNNLTYSQGSIFTRWWVHCPNTPQQPSREEGRIHAVSSGFMGLNPRRAIFHALKTKQAKTDTVQSSADLQAQNNTI